MGFEWEDCQSAIEAGNNTLESAVEWANSKTQHVNSQSANVLLLPNPKNITCIPSQEPSTSAGGSVQLPIHLSSRYTVSEEHQKAKQQFMEKERENARMEAKRRKLMEKRARQEILQQIAEDKVNRHERRLTKPGTHPATSQPAISASSGTPKECLKDRKQCLLQIRGPTGLLRRETFSPDAKLEEVMLFIRSQYHLTSDIYDLLQPFPHRIFTAADMLSTLADLGLSPSGSLVVKKKDCDQASTGTGHDSAELDPSGIPTAVSTCRNELSSPGNSNNSQPLHRNDDSDDDDDDNDDDGDNMHNSDEEEQEGVPNMLNRSPPPELQDFPEIPNPNVLGIGGFNNVIARGRGHMWGAGVRLGAVEHNPHNIDPVLRAQSPGESAVRRLEMRQHLQRRPETGTSRVIQEDQPILHRDVQRLEDLCINHVGYRLPGHQNPISSLGTLPHAVCDKILMHLMKNKSLSPKAMQAFISCGLRNVKLDCYPLVTNELLIALRLHRHLTHLSLKACPLITDRALEAVGVLKRLKSLNLSQCSQLTDKCFYHIKELPSLATLQMDMTKITDAGVCHFMENAACCPNLAYISFSGTNITDHSLQAMRDLKALKVLVIGNTKISSLEVVHQLPQLEMLNVSHTEICDDSLVALENHPSLASLSLLSTNVTDDGLCHLQGLKLSTVKLPNRLHITDQGINNIQVLPLVALDLSDYIHITDNGVYSIAHMTSSTALTELEELNLDRTLITDDGCTVLSCFRHLRILGLSSTRISNKLLLNGTLNECKTLTQLNLSRTRISDKRLDQLVLPVLSQLNLDWTRVTPSGCLTLLTGCPSLKALRTNNCTPPSQDSEDSDEEQQQQ
ncbi:unnamed protein product [Porites evermanni]|uniref:UBX domain-containing protein n=1 Tax=Porites evermanni TaxID=104178 RepID=A0ABN8S420_9CNID|nr:unnamed protein product [Porites evermanni]